MDHPLKQYRAMHELTQAELAKRLGCSQSLIALIETKSKHVTSENAAVWEGKLGIPRLTLLYPREYPYRPQKRKSA